MKLLYCKDCSDLIELNLNERTCICGKTKGRYIDNVNAVYSGNCIPMGVNNNFLLVARRLYEEFPGNYSIELFTIPEDCKTMKKEKL